MHSLLRVKALLNAVFAVLFDLVLLQDQVAAVISGVSNQLCHVVLVKTS